MNGLSCRQHIYSNGAHAWWTDVRGILCGMHFHFGVIGPVLQLAIYVTLRTVCLQHHMMSRIACLACTSRNFPWMSGVCRMSGCFSCRHVVCQVVLSAFSITIGSYSRKSVV